MALHERCNTAVEPLWVDGAGHNDIELFEGYNVRLCSFIDQLEADALAKQTARTSSASTAQSSAP